MEREYTFLRFIESLRKRKSYKPVSFFRSFEEVKYDNSRFSWTLYVTLTAPVLNYKNAKCFPINFYDFIVPFCAEDIMNKYIENR